MWDLAEVRQNLRELGLDWTAAPIRSAPIPAPGSAAAVLEQAWHEHLLEHYAEAVAAYTKALVIDDKQAAAYRDRGEAQFQLQRFAEEGVTHLIVQLEPQGIESIEQFGRIVELLHQEMPDAALFAIGILWYWRYPFQGIAIAIFLIVAPARSILDYALNWDMYFPREDLPVAALLPAAAPALQAMDKPGTDKPATNRAS